VRNACGFTLVELFVVVSVIGILASTAVILYADVTHRPRVARAQAHIRSTTGPVVAVVPAPPQRRGVAGDSTTVSGP